MDFYRKYSDHQTALFQASAAPDSVMRELHLDRATAIAEEVTAFQLGLGAAASCAWSALRLGVAAEAASKPARLGL